MKKTKTGGFTLIELLVVISIIALLSSVVLASLKGAREKAILNKAASEMKSLQIAVELYRNQFGRYPGELEYSNYDDDSGCNYICALWYAGDIDSFFTTELVNRKLLSKVPHAPNYPNNCVDSNCSFNGYVLGYSILGYTGFLHKDNNSTTEYLVCGNQRVKNYVIYLAANNKKLNLPILGIYDGGFYYDLSYWLTADINNKIYCISG